MRALPSFSISAYADASEQERGLLGWDQRYTQMGTGRFEGSVVRMEFGRVSISEERLNVSVAETTAPPLGKVVLILPAPAVNSRINGTKREGPGFLHMGGHEINVVTDETTQGYYVTLNQKDLPVWTGGERGPYAVLPLIPGLPN